MEHAFGPEQKKADWLLHCHPAGEAFRLRQDRDITVIEASGPAEEKTRFGAAVRTMKAGGFRGGAVRLAARLLAEDAHLGSFWLRVDAAPGEVLRFENLIGRGEGLSGTSGWTGREIRLDVPVEAASGSTAFREAPSASC